MKRVLFIANYPSPYRVHFYDELSKHVDVTVLFSDRLEEKVTRDAAWFVESKGTSRFVQLKKCILTVGGRDLCTDVIPWVKKQFDAIIVCGYSSPTAILAMAYMRLRKIRFYMEVDGGLIREDSKLKYMAKRLLVTLPNAWISSGKHTTDYLKHYGAKEDAVEYYPFTSLFAADIPESTTTQDEKQRLRKEMKMPEKKIIISVSRFIPSKRLDMLIHSAADLGGEVGVYLIGGEPTESFLRIQKERNATNVHFVGFCKKEELTKYYRAADMFALPTQTDVWGLVINEAMAYGLPIVTTDRCVAGLELVEDGVNGYLVPINDQEALTQKICAVLESDYRSMGAASLEKIRPYTLENMAKAHVDIFNRN